MHLFITVSTHFIEMHFPEKLYRNEKTVTAKCLTLKRSKNAYIDIRDYRKKKQSKKKS